MNIFDTSKFFDNNNIISIDDFINNIKPIIEDILKERFPYDKYRQNVKIHGKNRISFACPFCGDSHNDSHKKRGNIILSPGAYQYKYKCFNCDAYMNIDTFLKKYNKNISLNIIDFINQQKNSFISTKKDLSTNILFNIEEIENKCIEREYLKNKLNLIDVNKNNDGGIYLLKRCQYDFSKFLFDNKNKILYILNLTPNGKVLGLQTRPLIKKNNSKYKTYKLSNIYNLLLKENKEIEDSIDNLSMFFNILLVDYSNPIIIVEGPLDSFLIKNSIATCGAGKNIPLDLLFYYLYDSDKTGNKKAIEKLNENNYIFLWSKYKKDIGLPPKEKWDINDVVIYCSINKIKMPNIFNYFSNDKLDIIDL